MSVSTFYSKKAAAINTYYGGGDKENMHHKDTINELNLKGCILNKNLSEHMSSGVSYVFMQRWKKNSDT